MNFLIEKEGKPNRMNLSLIHAIVDKQVFLDKHSYITCCMNTLSRTKTIYKPFCLGPSTTSFKYNYLKHN